MVQVLNRFESPEDATNRDNPLVLDGTVEGTAIDAIQGRQITTYLADVSTAASAFALPGFAGTVVKVTTIRGGTIDSGSSTVQPRIEGIAIPGTTINFGAAGPGGETANSPTTGSYGHPRSEHHRRLCRYQSFVHSILRFTRRGVRYGEQCIKSV